MTGGARDHQRVDSPPCQYAGLRVYCDESNSEPGKPYPVDGASMAPADHVETVRRELQQWREREQLQGEIKWNKLHGYTRLVKYTSLVDLIFSLAGPRQLLQFKAIILDRRAPEYKTYSKGNDELG